MFDKLFIEHIQTPGDVANARFGKLLFMRLGFLDFFNLWLFFERFILWLFPDKEFSLKNICKPRLNNKQKRFFVDPIKCQHECEYNKSKREGNTEKTWQDTIENVGTTRTAGEVDELSKCERTENLVFDVDKLRNAKLHTDSIAGEKHDTN